MDTLGQRYTQTQMIHPCDQSWIDGGEESSGKGRIRQTDNQRPLDTGRFRQMVIGYSSRQRAMEGSHEFEGEE